MKTFLFLLILFSHQAYSQDETAQPRTPSTQVKKVEVQDQETIEEPTDQDRQEAEEQPATANPNGQNVFQIQCQCPEPVQQEETNTGLPANSVFFIAPQPAPIQQEQEVAPKDESIPPGYGGKVRSGYSDTDYKQI